MQFLAIALLRLVPDSTPRLTRRYLASCKAPLMLVASGVSSNNKGDTLKTLGVQCRHHG